MVKHCTKCIKLFLLALVLVTLGFAMWVHQAERSLKWVKPWIASTINPKDAPYVIALGDVTLDWRDVTRLGKLRITQVSIAKRGGDVFAQLPEIFVTIDPIGFLPSRRMLHKVYLHSPRLFMTRNSAGGILLGVEDSKSPMPLAALFTSVTGDAATSDDKSPRSLPFHEFLIDRATLNFSDEASGTKIVVTPFAMRLAKNAGRYDAALALPFTYEDLKGRLDASLRTATSGSEHLVNVKMAQVPAKLLCVFGLCPDGVNGAGPVDGTIGVRLTDDGTPQGIRANISTKGAVLDAPQWFEKPLKLGASQLVAESDAAAHTITLTSMKLALEDTTITGQGVARHAVDGWYIDATAEAGLLDVTKIAKYWPLVMAPESRSWVTSKMKSGFAQKGVVQLKLTPADLAAEYVSDAAVSATVDARDITFEYLPGFPLVQKMNGDVRFTGNTLKIDGSAGSLLTGTRISKATLWCPDLNSPTTPMESTVTVNAPASDVVTLLALPQFTFDDGIGLDATKISGTVDATVGLKFDAFSEKPQANLNEVRFDTVKYDISTVLRDVAQEKLFEAYSIKNLSGDLKANNAGLNFSGSVALGETGVSMFSISQPSGKALVAEVKSRGGQVDKPINDFKVVYESGAEPKINISGKRLDVSQPYGTGKGSILKDFPPMHLKIDLGELAISASQPLSQVSAYLDCSVVRCNAADFTASSGRGSVHGAIVQAGGSRQFKLNATNAGSFLTALDITDRMIDGKLSFNGTYDDAHPPAALDARLLIEDFTLKNSQILGRILSIGSLTGLSNALTGSGISFDKMAANVIARDGLITVSKGRANGTALGITVDGTVDTSTTSMNLKGVVVPAYALNSIIGKIPLIGAIAGGEGEGLIAFNYAVRGTYSNPDVMVNPLSGLTPGFLRGIFGVFDGGEPNTASPAAPSTKKKVEKSRVTAPNNGR